MHPPPPPKTYWQQAYNSLRHILQESKYKCFISHMPRKQFRVSERLSSTALPPETDPPLVAGAKPFTTLLCCMDQNIKVLLL